MPFHVLNDADAAGVAEMTSALEKTKWASSLCSPSGQASEAPCSMTANFCPTPNLDTFTCTTKSQKPAPPPASRRKEICLGPGGTRVNDYLQHLDFIFSPDLFIIGGGILQAL